MAQETTKTTKYKLRTEKILTTNKGFSAYQSIRKKRKQQVKIEQKAQTFHRTCIWMTFEYMARYTNSLATPEWLIDVSITHHFTIPCLARMWNDETSHSLLMK